MRIGLCFVFLFLLTAQANAQALRAKETYIGHKQYETFNLYLIQIKGETTLSQATTNASNTIVVTSATGAVIGEAVNVFDKNHVFQTIVSNISGTTITLASPTDRAFPAGSAVQFGAWNMAQNGSVTPVTHQFKPVGNKEYHIVTISGSMTDNATIDETTFGGLPALTTPVYMFLDNAEDNKFFVVTNNAGFYEWGADTNYPDKVPSGQYAFRFRKLVGDINEAGVLLDPKLGDSVKHVNRSDLSGLTKYVIPIHGHISD